MIIQTNDRISYPITSRTFTDEGFLRVPGRVARIGIQEYLACELGLDGEPNRVVKVMRPESEVFKQESLDTYLGADATNDHPSELVNPNSYKDASVGVCVGPGTRDGDFVVCDMIIKDAAAIKAIESGKVQLSAGYKSVYKDAPTDADYEFIQTDIRINHVALVDRARAGHQAKLFDKQTEPKSMEIVQLDSGRTVEFEDKAVAALVTDSIARLAQQVKDAESKATEAEIKKEKAEDELEEFKKTNSEDSIKAKIAEVSKTLADAKLVAGDKFTSDSVDVTAIKRAALAVARPKRDFTSKDAAYIDGVFDNELEDRAEAPAVTSDKAAIAVDAASSEKTVVDARNERKIAAANAWQKTVGIK